MPTKTARKKVKPKKAKQEWSKDELSEYAAKSGDLADKITAGVTSVENLRKQLKSEKEILAGHRAELERISWEMKHPEAHPLFNKPASKNGQAEGSGQASPATAATASEPADNDSWRAVKLEELTEPAIPEAILQKLHDAQLHTLGELTNWTAADGGRHRITDIPGVGPHAAEKIELATTGFWERWGKSRDVIAQVAGGADPSVAPAEAASEAPAPDPLEAARAVVLSKLQKVQDHPETLKRLKAQQIKTVGDLLDRAKDANVSPLDYLRGFDLNMIEADQVLDQAKEAATAAPPAKEKKAKAGRSRKRKGG